MPEKETLERARKDAREGKSPSTQAGEFVREEIEHVRGGKHGARSTKQAIAIGLSKARRAGVKLPPPPEGKTSERTRKQGGPKPRSRAVTIWPENIIKKIESGFQRFEAGGQTSRVVCGAGSAGARERPDARRSESEKRGPEGRAYERAGGVCEVRRGKLHAPAHEAVSATIPGGSRLKGGCGQDCPPHNTCSSRATQQWRHTCSNVLCERWVEVGTLASPLTCR